MNIAVFVALAIVSAQCLSSEMSAQTVDNPLQMTLFHPTRVVLDKNAMCYVSIPLPAGAFKLVVDTQRPEQGNLISTISGVDMDGAVIENAVIHFNEIDWGYRRVHSFEVPKATIRRFKLTNYVDRSDFWVTVVGIPHDGGVSAAPGFEGGNLQESDLAECNARNAAIIPVPFFGGILPRLATVGQAVSGTLGFGQSNFFVTMIPKGEYRVVLGFDHLDGENTNLMGYVALLESVEGGQHRLITLNEIDVSTRRTVELSIKKSSVIVLRVENMDDKAVNYSMKVRSATGE